MNHPTREDWIAYLYGELTEPAKQNLDAHLHVCPQCNEQLAAWRQTQRLLNHWEIPASGARVRFVQPALKWAIAALFVLGIGFGLGYVAGPSLNASTLRADIEASIKDSLDTKLRQQVRQELKSEFDSAIVTAHAQWTNQLASTLAKDLERIARQTLDASIEQTESLLAAYDVKRQQDERSTLTTLKTYFDTRLTRHAADLETVALLTEATFRNAQRQISQLAGYTPVNLKDTE